MKQIKIMGSEYIIVDKKAIIHGKMGDVLAMPDDAVVDIYMNRDEAFAMAKSLNISLEGVEE